MEFHLFDNDTRFDVKIILSLRHDVKTTDVVIRNHKEGVEFFKSKGFNIQEDITADNEEIDSDVLIWCDPYDHNRSNKYYFKNINLGVMMVFLPYGFFLWKGESLQERLNMELLHYSWLAFTDTMWFKQTAAENCLSGNSNMYYSGYPKMDVFYKRSDMNFEWKMIKEDSKKIVYAPHWSVNGGCNFSTFLDNCMFFLEYAQNNIDSTSWVIKPHPNLLYSAVCDGGFSTEAELKTYFEKWDNLPNAKVVVGGGYESIFASSDALIGDSVSFLAEYQYTSKPLIFLTRETQEFNGFGEELKNVLYCVSGEDLDGIKSLIDKVILSNNDYMFERRRRFFEEKLNYKSINKCLASEYIYGKIVNTLE